MPQIIAPIVGAPAPSPAPSPAPAPAPAPGTGGGTTTTTTVTPLPGGGTTTTVTVTPIPAPAPLAQPPNILTLSARGTAILALIQSFCREYALPVPGALQGSQDGGALQMRELMQSVGEDIWTSTEWQECKRLVTFTTVRGADQGDIRVLCPENMAYIIPETFWDNTLRVPVKGPLSSYEWQTQRAQATTGTFPIFRVAGNRLEMSAGTRENHLMSLVYKSRNWLYTNASATNDRITTDADVSMYSDTLMKRGLRAFWLRAKQMPHAFEMALYDNLKQQEGSSNVIKPVLQMDSEPRRAGVGITIPLGSWTK